MPAEDFLKCPKGHSLPYKAEGGFSCSPIKCGAVTARMTEMSKAAAEKLAAKKAAKRTAAGLAPSGPPLPAVPAQAKSEAPTTALATSEEARLVAGAQAEEKILKFLGYPKGLTGDAAEKFADAKLVSLLPLATMVLEDHVRFGSRSEKKEAARDILNANGRGKRDSVGASAPPIVIQVSGGSVELPWRKASTATVEGQKVSGPTLPKPDGES